MNPVLQRAIEDTQVQRRLTSAATDDALVDMLGDLELGGADPRTVLETARAGLGAPLDWSRDSAPPPQWLPVQVYETPEGPQIEWHHFGFARSTEPFFEGSMRRAGALPAQPLLRFRTPIDALLAFDGATTPDGLIFHMSRCGSTLVAQMLAELARVTVISEAPAFDIALRLHLAGRLSGGHVRGMAGALARARHPGVEACVFKLDAWHTPASERIVKLFPRARAVFLHRDPIEVLVSQARRPGLHVTPGALPLQLYGFGGGQHVAEADYPSWAIAEILRAGLEMASCGRVRVVDYATLPGALSEVILPHFDIVPDAGERDRIAEAGRRYSKDPTRVFAPDSASKRASAPFELVARAEGFGLPQMHRRLLAGSGASDVIGAQGPAIRVRFNFD